MENNFTLTVYFEDPFWVGVFERIDGKQLSVCKVTFGAEPKDYEVWDFYLKNWRRLKFSSGIKVFLKKQSDNPKRIQRQLRKQANLKGVSTKSQEALRLQREENKLERKKNFRENRDFQKQHQYELRKQKHKEKHNGK